MIFQVILAVFATLLASANAAYSNSTSYSPTTITLSPTYTVSPQTSVASYADETTTFFITSTIYSTFWYTPVTTSSVAPIILDVEDLTTTYSSSGATYTSTITSTITSTVRVSDQTEAATGYETTQASQAALPSTDACTPTTVTVTVTPEPSIQYVTVTASASQWVNGTNVN